ncbi:30S ribosomal protein S14 [Plasmodium vivax India VII]|uniref:30S ribosomal protein S14, putative n=5 Tax=Plasmodium vivax TaxID=5855 RepID=A5K535_PLAVS|nr:30S ribosomal protein S14, putative [Plasmodium vivax]KMZ80340.1 30S ribosomal protein S14 [Plasmodium vivax India VII]KMZ86517.1 30S ribosomal protein S14 [Plasmodium vivax Brazil I]KMZ92930.1 30S ribosomal protein S14 [Plasmodium vivax Mauritania I]KMZ99452.1 30S ribosomal protein S14 [Plasmodium vivax North Korean]EDL45763.1 30S ribosomal protein S14, putative [Plasmodium vivax]|eukprot:XP_001615490.1 30S ribosomal protein S14 [Plasmodium vivax Sal-1]
MLKFIKFFFLYLVLTNAKKTLRTNGRGPRHFFLNGSTTFGAKRKSQSCGGKITPLHLKKRLDPNDKYTVIKRHEAKVQRNLKRKYLIERYKEKRELLKKYIAEASSPIEYVYWKYKLSSLPRDSCPVRFRNRARGYYSFFGLCRHQARALIQKMFFPGFVKACW